MRRLLLTFIYLGIGAWCMAQGTVRYEYWFDNEHSTRVTASATGSQISINADVSRLRQGVHFFCFRFQDGQGKWSVPVSSLFYHTGANSKNNGVWQYEYWFDNDFTNKKTVRSSNATLLLNEDVSKLSEGIHFICYRVKDKTGLWTKPHSALFIKPLGGGVTDSKVSAYQYWFDQDFEHAGMVQLDNPVSTFVLDMDFPTDDLDDVITPDNLMIVQDEFGYNVVARKTFFNIRFKDNMKGWSDVQGTEFANILEDPNLTPFIQNPDADEDTEYWETEGVVDISKNDHYSQTPNNYFRLKGGIDESSSMSQAIEGLPSVNLRLSFMARTQNGARLEVSAAGQTVVVSSSTWTRYHVDFMTDEEEPFNIEALTDGVADIDNFTLGLAIDETPLNEADFLALKSFYSEMNGPSWTHTWQLGSTAANTSRLDGVKTRAGRVVRVSLPDNNLSGSLSAALFALSELTDINLSRNRLTGDIGELMNKAKIKGIQCSHLRYLNLSDNLLTGNVGAISDNFGELMSLDVAGCHLSELSPALPSHITRLDISRQTIDRVYDYDELISGGDVSAILPSILLYEHETRSYRDTQTFTLTDNEANPSWKARLALRNGGFSLSDYDPSTAVYRLENNSRLTAKSHLSSLPVRFGFRMGDTDFNGQVNVSDLQQTINMSLERPLRMYNHTAMNIIVDEVINVQDIAALVTNMLSTPHANGMKAPAFMAQEVDETTVLAHLYVEDGCLMLSSEVPVAAFDLTLSGTADDVIWLLGDLGMQCSVSHDGTTTRVIGYSLAGFTLPIGQTKIAHVGNGFVVCADLVDSDALELPVALNVTPTHIASARTGLDLSARGGAVRLWTEQPQENVVWSVCTFSGKLLGKGVIDRLPTGSTILCVIPDIPVIIRVVSEQGIIIKKVTSK